MTGLYVHVPFCVKKCDYCDFYSVPGRADLIDSYVDAVLMESRTYRGLSCETIYLGGGTPSLLGANRLAGLIAGLEATLHLTGLSEATIEVNPDSASEELLTAAIASKIDRVSIGVQSLSDYELKSVGRIHAAFDAVKTIKSARTAGFKSISADVIVGLPGQARKTLLGTLATLTGLGIDHLSLYCLSLEPGTPLATSPPGDLPPDDTQAELFTQASAFLEEQGFSHYEISNFALEGHECKHNLNYWRGGEYIGLGPGAASHLHGKRFRNRASLEDYLQNSRALMEDIETLGPKEKAAEEAMLRLRLLTEGLNIRDLRQRFGDENVVELEHRLDRMTASGLLIFDGAKYRLPESRVLTSNPIFTSVLG